MCPGLPQSPTFDKGRYRRWVDVMAGPAASVSASAASELPQSSPLPGTLPGKIITPDRKRRVVFAFLLEHCIGRVGRLLYLCDDFTKELVAIRRWRGVGNRSGGLVDLVADDAGAYEG